MNIVNSFQYNPRTAPIFISYPPEKRGVNIRSIYTAICDIWKQAGWNNTIPVSFDESRMRVVTHLTPSQLRDMGFQYPLIKHIIYYDDLATIFDGYNTGFSASFPTIDLGFFGDTARDAFYEFPLNIVETLAPTTKEESTAERTLQRWLTVDGFQGVLIGENYGERWSKAFLVENMTRLKDAGVTTLFLEFLGTEQQEAVDRYLNSDVPDILPPPEVLAIIRCQDERHNLPQGSRFLDLLNSAKTQGIRVVGMENEASKQFGFDVRYGTTKRMRNIGLHYVAKTIIDREKGEGKYVALVGNGHIRNNTGTPGLSDLLGAPALLLMDDNFVNQSRVKKGFNINSPLPELNGLYHAVFACRKPLPLFITHEGMDQRGAEDRLIDCPVGAWLIREGVTTPGSVVFVIKEQNRIFQKKYTDRAQLFRNIKISTTLDPDLQQLP